MSDEWQFVEVKQGGYQVPCKLIRAQSSQKTILILPALGVRASFYQSLANRLAENGFNVVLFEQRGYGHSSIKPSRSLSWGFKEYLEQDIDAAVDWAKQQTHGEVALMGHSLGGHLAVCYSALNPSKVSKLILPACGSPWSKAYSGVARIQISILYHLIPILNTVFGYYKGATVGFGGDEARGVMQDWRSLAKHNLYTANGIDIDLQQKLGEFNGDVLGLRYADDALAPEAATEAVLGKFSAATVSRELIEADRLTEEGRLKADHFSWAKHPQITVEKILAWW